MLPIAERFRLDSVQSISSIFVVLRHDGPSNSPPFLCSSVCPSMMDMHALPCLPVTAAGTSLTLNFPVAFCCSIGHAGTMNGDSPANGQHLIFIWILPLPISRLISASDVSSYTMFQPSVVGDRNTRAFQQCRNRDRRGSFLQFPVLIKVSLFVWHWQRANFASMLDQGGLLQHACPL